jgi:hypothetical protein
MGLGLGGIQEELIAAWVSSLGSTNGKLQESSDQSG